MKSLPLKAVLMAIFCNILFGSAFPAIKLGYEAFGITDSVLMQVLFAGIRFFISGIIVFIYGWIRNRRVPAFAAKNALNIGATALLYTFLQYIFFYLGLSNTGGASGSIINSSSVFIAVILAHFLYRNDRLTPGRILGSVLGFGGVLFATLANDRMEGFSFWGEGFILIAATCFVVGSVFNKKATKLDDSITVTAYNLLIGGGLLILLGLWGGTAGLVINPKGILILLYLCMVSAVGFTVWSSLLRHYPLGKISIYNFIIPVSGTVLSALTLRENILRYEYLLALALVSIGIILVNKEQK